MIESIESSNDFDVTEHVERLQQIRSGVSPIPFRAQAVEEPQAPEPQPLTQLAAQPAAEAIPSIAESFDRGTYAEFLFECHENLDQIEQDLLALEQDPTRKTLLRRIFRTMHMIRGGAGFLGLARLERLTKIIEDLISDLRDDSKELEKRHIHALQHSARKCREGLGLVSQFGSDEGLDVEALLEQLWQLHDHDRQFPGSSADSAIPVNASAHVSIQAATPPPTVAAVAATKPLKDSPVSTGKPVAPIPADPLITASRPARESKSASREAAAAPEGDRQLPSAADTTIRVDVALLDKLMTRVGELVLARNQILQHTSAIQDANFISTAHCP